MAPSPTPDVVLTAAFLDSWQERLARDPEILTHGRAMSVDLVLRVVDDHLPGHVTLPFRAGRLVTQREKVAPRIELAAPPDVWRNVFAATPPPGHIDLAGLERTVPQFQVVCGREQLLRHLRVLNRVIALARESRAGSAPAAASSAGQEDTEAPWVEDVTGRYLHVDIQGRRHRIFVEEAGSGPPLVCLHTAGADSRQWRHLLNDPKITARHRVIAFDLPWHGRSLPPDGWWAEEFLLTADYYCGAIEAVCVALQLQSPILIGCSMGGSAVLEMTRRQPQRFGGGIAVSGAAKLAGRFSDMSIRPDLNAQQLVPSWVWGLMHPDAEERARREVWWIYSQGGPGVYRGGTYFYSEDLDLRQRTAEFDTEECPLVLLTGTYDYACTPGDSALTAAAIAGAHFIEMPDLGHFAPAENYPIFRGYLAEALETLAQASS